MKKEYIATWRANFFSSSSFEGHRRALIRRLKQEDYQVLVETLNVYESNNLSISKSFYGFFTDQERIEIRHNCSQKKAKEILFNERLEIVQHILSTRYPDLVRAELEESGLLKFAKDNDLYDVCEIDDRINSLEERVDKIEWQPY